MAEGRDYYSILQVNRRASAEEIERSYERLSKLYDPDVSRKRRASERWQQIKEAYETLSDPAKRAEYDRAASPRRLPGIAGETAVTRFLASRWGLPSLAALIGSIVIIAVIVAVFAGGGGDDNAVADITTPAPLPTDSPTPGPTPPAVSGAETTTDSGLTIITLEEGTGASPVLGDKVVVEYSGWTEADGHRFDTTDGDTPRDFTLLEGGLIGGWIEGLPLMKEGGKARLIIPGALGYGENGNPNAGIGPNATLIFDIYLIDVIRPGETAAPLPTPTPSPAPAASPTATAQDGSPSPSSEPTPTPEPTS